MHSPSFPDYCLRRVRPADLERCYAIESGAYEGDEAATLEKIRTRIETYPDGFLVLEIDGQVVGFINSGCADEVRMADEAFKELVGHDPRGRHNVVMSLVVDPAWQGRGLSAVLMANYVLRMRRFGKQSIQLMCKTRHIGLYQRFGFRYVRESASFHGGMAWHEMILPLD